MITSDEGDGETRPLWLSDGPATARLWSRLRAEHAASGLWPLLLDCLALDDTAFRPWASGELSPEGMSSPAEHDPQEVLARWWQESTATGGEGDQLSAAERLAVTAPFGRTWPGLSPALAPSTDPDKLAEQYALVFQSLNPHVRLGLVAAPGGAEALTAVGWTGPVNHHDDTAAVSAVVRDWEGRFGVRVVGVGFSTLHLSVAAPPRRREEALAVAAEHFAFCPDTVWQGAHRDLSAYADALVDLDCWTFWWD
ncbi:DUF4253 domain-containing protein [Streptomyces sp. G45]|uniref:DUF4253 domain-containing protein n=1 Tax=Streptomyces sp. G45 TaxID=3406627 RepID=UPI003C157AF3